jgi:exodeoxyribonuclease V beta subunit
MVRSMAESGYFLQALLYLTALHRHLKRVDKDHDPWRHLGGLRYVYLRGLRQEDPDSGVLTDILPVELILELDQELGRLA